MNAFPKTRSSGFSLIEVMVAIAIMAILATVAVPSFRTWIQNIQIRTAAESLSNGLQRARAEAVARNTNVEFVLGTGYVSGTGFVTSLTRPDLCPNFISPKFSSCWVVRVVGDAGPPIDSRLHNEGSANVTPTALAADIPPVVPPTFNSLTPATTITFNNFALIVANADTSATLARIDLAAVGGSKNLRVTIATGGSTRMCDPSLASGSSPRAC